jgi:two-component system, OmpR family, response regulator TctD
LSTALRESRLGGGTAAPYSRPMRILLAEDEHTLGTWLSKALEHAGIQVEWVDDGRLADRALQQRDHDALVLDLGLPGLDGHAVLQRLRERDQRLPALILTARDSLDERVSALNAGADDFLAKPFALAELEARLHALVRRARGVEHPRLACGPLVYDGARRQFTLAGEALALSPRELAVLRVLVQRSGEPLSKQQILERVFSDDEEVHPEAVEVLVYRLRKRLDGSGVRIVTLRGLGYVLEAD